MTQQVLNLRKTGIQWISIAVLMLTIFADQSVSGFQRNKKHSLTGIVTDSDGNAIEGARIVLAHKSWPGNRFRMKTYAAKTKSDGVFTFKNQYYANQNSEFLVTVVANGHAMVSDYFENPTGEKLDPLEFELEPAMEKTIVVSKKGKPLAKTRIFAKSRTTKDGDEHFIYPVSASKMTLQTDAQGRVKMNIFRQGDRAVLGVNRRGNVEFVELTIDAAAEQTIGSPPANSGAEGQIKAIVQDDSGNPISGAKVLVSHKTWPNRRFRMNSYDGETSEDGTCICSDEYDSQGRNGILISVLADGYVMSSQYVTSEGEKLPPFEFKLTKANSIKFTFENQKGRGLSRALVLPVSRSDGEGEEHMIYPASASDFSFKTNENGELDLSLFEEGDEVEFLVQVPGGAERAKVTIGDSDTQTITVKKKLKP